MLHAFASNACATFGYREMIVQQGRVGQVVGLAYGVFCAFDARQCVCVQSYGDRNVISTGVCETNFAR